MTAFGTAGGVTDPTERPARPEYDFAQSALPLVLHAIFEISLPPAYGIAAANSRPPRRRASFAAVLLGGRAHCVTRETHSKHKNTLLL